MNWRRKQAELDRLNLHIGRLFGLAFGVVTGAIIGFLIDLRVQTVVLFSHDIAVAVAIVFGVIGYVFGERFVRFISRLLEHAPDAGVSDFHDTI